MTMQNNTSSIAQQHSLESDNPTPAENKTMFSLADVNSNDVLCGRGAFVNKHSGNMHFRHLVAQQKVRYASAKSMEKNQIASQIVHEIASMDPPGRFLKRCSVDESMWKVVSDKNARGKTSQALREKGGNGGEKNNTVSSSSPSSQGKEQGQRKRRRSVDLNEAAPTLSEKDHAMMQKFYLEKTYFGHPMQHHQQFVHTRPILSPPFAWRDGFVPPPQAAALPMVTPPPPPSFVPLQFHKETPPMLMKPERTTSGGMTPEVMEKPSSPLHVLSEAIETLNTTPPASPTTTTHESIHNEINNTPVVDYKDQVVTKLNDNDVLLGRGAGVNRHTGNRRFRDLVQSQRSAYMAAVKLDKKGIAQSIVQTIRAMEPVGRFLTKHPSQEGAWVDVGNERAREKTSQALREGAPAQRQQQQHQELQSPQMQAKVGVKPQEVTLSKDYTPSSNYLAMGQYPAQPYSRQMLELMLAQRLPFMPYGAVDVADGSWMKKRRIGAHF